MPVSNYFLTAALNCNLHFGLSRFYPHSVTKLRNRRLRRRRNPDGSFLEISSGYKPSSGRETSARWGDTILSMLFSRRNKKNKQKKIYTSEVCNLRLPARHRARTQIFSSSFEFTHAFNSRDKFGSAFSFSLCSCPLKRFYIYALAEYSIRVPFVITAFDRARFDRRIHEMR